MGVVRIYSRIHCLLGRVPLDSLTLANVADSQLMSNQNRSHVDVILVQPNHPILIHLIFDKKRFLKGLFLAKNDWKWYYTQIQRLTGHLIRFVGSLWELLEPDIHGSVFDRGPVQMVQLLLHKVSVVQPKYQLILSRTPLGHQRVFIPRVF